MHSSLSGTGIDFHTAGEEADIVVLVMLVRSFSSSWGGPGEDVYSIPSERGDARKGLGACAVSRTVTGVVSIYGMVQLTSISSNLWGSS